MRKRPLALVAALSAVLGLGLATPAATAALTAPTAVTATRQPDGSYAGTKVVGATTVRVGTVAPVTVDATVAQTSDSTGVTGGSAEAIVTPAGDAKSVPESASPRWALHASMKAAGMTDLQAEQTIQKMGGQYDANAALYGVNPATDAANSPPGTAASKVPAVATVSDVGCSGKPMLANPVTVEITNAYIHSWNTHYGCKDTVVNYPTGQSWWVAEKHQASFYAKTVYSGCCALNYKYVPSKNRTWSVELLRNSILDWSPRNDVQADNGCVDKTVGLSIAHTGLSFSQSETVCDGHQSPIGPATSVVSGQQYAGSGWFQNCGWRDFPYTYSCYASTNKTYSYAGNTYVYSPLHEPYYAAVHADMGWERG